MEQQQGWTEEQYAAYELGMQTEREHQEALARLVMQKHEAEIANLKQQLAEARIQLSGAQGASDELEALMWGEDDSWDDELGYDTDEEAEARTDYADPLN